MKILFASDLDNTLIHSYKHRRDGDICIEKIHDADQGFMNEKTFFKLRELFQKVIFVPLTTRSIEQYRRIQWPENLAPDFAVCTNGGILLEKNSTAINSKWLSEIKAEIFPFEKEMEKLLPILQADSDFIRVRKVDEIYLFAYCASGIDVEKKSDFYARQTELSVEPSGKKIYFLPPSINKGQALERLKATFSPDLVIAAGDSSIDIPMLERSDMAFCKKEIIDEVHAPQKVLFSDERDLIEQIFEKIT